MLIRNNVITIAKGETPTYKASFIDKITGVPYMISSGIENPVVEFVVRPSIYSRDNDYVFKVFVDQSEVHKFADDSPSSVVLVDDWTEGPVEGEEGLLHKRVIGDTVEYKYWDGDETSPTYHEWVDYEFSITVTFPYTSTSKMENKTYKYEISLFGCSGYIVDDNDKIIGLDGIDYKRILLEATDFIVGGSLSE